jgi:hypothetical protein
MGKWVASDVLDGALQVIAGATRMVALPAAPGTYSAAVSGKLAEVPLGAGDFSFSAGDVSGRKVMVAAKGSVPVTTGGTATHVALVDTAGARLLYVTTCPDQQLVAGGEVNFDGWSVEIGAPL